MYLRRQKSEQKQHQKENRKHNKDSDEFKNDDREKRKVDAPGSYSKFRDYDDELYEGHDAARESNRERKELERLENLKENRAERRIKKKSENPRSYDPWQEERSEYNTFQQQYQFILTIVGSLAFFEKNIFNTRNNLSSRSLSVLVHTAQTKIRRLLYLSNDDNEDYEIENSPGTSEDSDKVREFHLRKEYLFKNMSKIATTLMQLHQQIAQIYVVQGRDKMEARSWRDFDRSFAKIHSYFPEEAEAFVFPDESMSSKLSNLLTQLQDLDSVI